MTFYLGSTSTTWLGSLSRFGTSAGHFLSSTRQRNTPESHLRSDTILKVHLDNPSHNQKRRYLYLMHLTVFNSFYLALPCLAVGLLTDDWEIRKITWATQDRAPAGSNILCSVRIFISGFTRDLWRHYFSSCYYLRKDHWWCSAQTCKRNKSAFGEKVSWHYTCYVQNVTKQRILFYNTLLNYLNNFRCQFLGSKYWLQSLCTWISRFKLVGYGVYSRC